MLAAAGFPPMLSGLGCVSLVTFIEVRCVGFTSGICILMFAADGVHVVAVILIRNKTV